MSLICSILDVLLLLAYAGAGFVYLRYFTKRTPELRRLARPALLATLALHLVVLVAMGLRQGWLPLVAPGHAMTFTVAAMMAIYLGVEMRTGYRVMGVFVLGLGFVFQLLSIFLTGDGTEVPDVLRTGRLPAHALPAIVGYAGLALGAVFAALLLLLRGRIKRRRIGMLYRRLPSLRVLDTMSFHANTMGFVLLTLGMLTGCLWAAREWGAFYPADPKLIGFLAIWLLYAVYVGSHWIPGWSRRLRAVWSVMSFAALTFAFVILGLLVDSRHSW